MIHIDFVKAFAEARQNDISQWAETHRQIRQSCADDSRLIVNCLSRFGAALSSVFRKAKSSIVIRSSITHGRVVE
jgi:hypothetical protein